jgi:methylenetetrahydrofolate dehydrogenase (NADP+)/methenyltetrahydrofolate cyclohydrolase
VALIIDGKAIAAKVRAEVAADAAALKARGVEPALALVLVGDDPASDVYVRAKAKAAQEVGITVFDHKLPAATSEAELAALVAELNHDPRVDGILLQLPLPAHLPERKLTESISVDKDVDGLHPTNLGLLWAGTPRFVAPTPAGIMRLLAESGAQLKGAHAVVLGDSLLVGRPMAALLINAHATVTVGHAHARDLADDVGRADILIADVGQAELIQGDWVKPGATVIDVGSHRGVDGKVVGDVQYRAAAARARAITPVPGGVGPMTIALLLANAVRAAAQRIS